MSHEDEDADAERSLAKAERQISLNPQDAAAHASKGAALSALERHDEAIAELELAAELAPNDPGVFVELGYALLYDAPDARALRAFDRAVSLEPSALPAHLGRGTVLLNMGRHADALSAFDRAVDIDRDDFMGHSRRADALTGLGRHEEAREALARSIRIDPDNAQSHKDMSILHCELHDPDKALESCDRAIALDKFLAPAHVARARALRYMERYDDAIGACGHARSLDPQDPDAPNVRGSVRFGLGDPGGALEDMVTACELDSRSAELHATRGHVLRALGRRDEALKAYNRALSLEDGFLGALLGKTVAFLDAGDAASALSACDTLLKAHHDSADAHLHAGLVYCELDRGGEARGVFRESAALGPGSTVPLLYALLTLAPAELGGPGTAKLPTGEIQYGPNEPGPHWSRATGLLAIGLHAEALPEIGMAIKLDPGVAAYRLAKGGVLERLGRADRASAEHSAALQALDHDISMGRRDADAHMMRRYALRALGRIDEAGRAYEQAVKLDPDMGMLACPELDGQP